MQIRESHRCPTHPREVRPLFVPEHRVLIAKRARFVARFGGMVDVGVCLNTGTEHRVPVNLDRVIPRTIR